jgi:hypothetical protein
VLNCTKDFEVKKVVAWKACTRLLKGSRNTSISNSVEIKFFRACVESTLLSNTVTWTRAATLRVS